jgi:hypothetical protein
MTDLTIRQILDAMTRALDTTARRFASQNADQESENTQPRRELADSADQTFETPRRRV